MRETLLSTAISIGAALSKKGGKQLELILRELEGPQPTRSDLLNSLSQEAQLVLFGERQLGRSRSPDQDQNRI